jgi:hypothetical protein
MAVIGVRIVALLARTALQAVGPIGLGAGGGERGAWRSRRAQPHASARRPAKVQPERQACRRSAAGSVERGGREAEREEAEAAVLALDRHAHLDQVLRLPPRGPPGVRHEELAPGRVLGQDLVALGVEDRDID